MLPFFRISIDPSLDDESGVYYNSLVDVPAHMKAMAFGQAKAIAYEFNEEERTVTGVFISVGTPIYRNDETHGKHYVVFDAETTTQIREKFHKLNFNHNMNIQHNMNQTREGVFLIESYAVGGKKSPGIPDIFKSQNLQPGSWIGTYKIENNSVWAEVKAGKYMGFSVEGLFYKDPLNIKTVKKTKQMAKKKTIFERLFGAESSTENFEQATTSDGVVLMWDGELAEGTAVFLEVEGGEPIPAPEGDHQVTLEDGTTKVVTIDAAGLITAVVDSQEDEPDDEGLRAEIEETLKAVLKDTHARFEKLEAQSVKDKATIEALQKEVKDLKEAKPSKFGGGGAAVETKKLTTSQILAGMNKNKK